MQGSLAIVQPSLFEGWSTVVEDAKALNKLLIVSNIEVHKEQLQNSAAIFFDPDLHIDLAQILIHFDFTKSSALYEKDHYSDSILSVAKAFNKIIE